MDAIAGHGGGSRSVLLLSPRVLLNLDLGLHDLEDTLRLVRLESMEALTGGTPPARLEEEHAGAGIAIAA
jgi:hypothetical protein